MSHEELLSAAWNEYNIPYYLGGGEKVYKALRAVIELHSPVVEPEGLDCAYCASAYPCPTNEAITKELI